MFRSRCTLGVMVVALLLLVPSVILAQGEDETKFGLGFQSSFPAWGVSGMVDLAPNVSVQGILGAFGDLKTYAGRGLLRFRREDYWNTYGYGMVGAWSYPWYKFDYYGGYEEGTETTLGFGAGIGIEYNWQGWAPNLPPVWWNLEIGVGMVDFDEADYSFSTMMFGAGAHYRF